MRTFFSLVAVVPVVMILWTALSLCYFPGESPKEQPKQPVMQQLDTPKKGKDPFAKPILPTPEEIGNTPDTNNSAKIEEKVSVQVQLFRFAFIAAGAVTLLWRLWYTSTKVDVTKPINKVLKPIAWFMLAFASIVVFGFVTYFAMQMAMVMGAILLTIATVSVAVHIANK